MTDLERQRYAIREAALVQRAADLGAIAVIGSERQSWLDGLVTCALKGKQAGEGAFGLSVSKNGRIQAELWILLGDERLLVGARRDRVVDLVATFDRHLIMEDAELADVSSDLEWVLVHGPRAAGLVPAAVRAGAVLAAPIDRTGLGGMAAAVPRDRSSEIATALVAAGGEGALLATPEAWAALRVELLIPEAGVDYDDQTYPQEASLERAAVSFDKGCYLGQETVFMLEHRGHVKRKLVQLRVEGEAAVPSGAEIAAKDGAALGQVTSTTPDPGGAAVLVLGWVKYKHAETGTDVAVAGRPARITIGR